MRLSLVSSHELLFLLTRSLVELLFISLILYCSCHCLSVSENGLLYYLWYARILINAMHRVT